MWVSGMTKEKPRHRRLRLAQSENELNKVQVEAQEGVPMGLPPFVPKMNQASKEKGLTPIGNCCMAVNFMSHDAGENVRGYWCEI